MANRDPKNVKRIIENISKKAAKKVYEDEDVEGVKVVDELPETGKDGDLVLVKKEIPTDIDITNVEFDVYGQNGLMTFVDKNGVYASQELLDQEATKFLQNFFGGFVLPTFFFGTLETFNLDIEDGEIIVLNNREEAIGKSITEQGKFFLKIGTIKLGELNFCEMPHYNEGSSKLKGNDVAGLIGNSFDFLQRHIEYKNSNITMISYNPSTDQQGIITEINSSEEEVIAPVYQVLERGEFYNFLDNPEQTAEWKAQAEAQGYGMFALVGGLECSPIEPEYAYEMYVYYGEEYNLIPSGDEAKEIEGSQLLPFVKGSFEQMIVEKSYRTSVHDDKLKIKSLDAIISLLDKYEIPSDLPFVRTNNSSGTCSLNIGPINIISDTMYEDYGRISINNGQIIANNLLNSENDTLGSFLETNRNAIEEAFSSSYFSLLDLLQYSYNPDPNTFISISYNGYDSYENVLYHAPIHKIIKAQELVDLFEPVEE